MSFARFVSACRALSAFLLPLALCGCQTAHDVALAGSQRNCERTPDARAALECRERLRDEAWQTRAERDRAAARPQQ